jgi:acyl carrier protein
MTTALTSEEVLAVIVAAVATVLEVDPATVTPDTTFRQLQADSLAVVEIVELLEQELSARARADFAIDDEDLDDLLSVGDALAYAMSRL